MVRQTGTQLPCVVFVVEQTSRLYHVSIDSGPLHVQPSGKAAPGKGSSGRREAHSESGEESDESDDEVCDDEDAPLPGELDDDDSDVADEDAIDVDSDDEDLPEADDEDDSDEQEEQQADSGAEDVPSTRAQANGRYAAMTDAGIAESSEGGSHALLFLWENWYSLPE